MLITTVPYVLRAQAMQTEEPEEGHGSQLSFPY